MTYVVDKEDGGNGHYKVDNTDHTGGQKTDRATGQTDLLEDGRGVVDDSVDTEMSCQCQQSFEMRDVSTHPVHCCKA